MCCFYLIINFILQDERRARNAQYERERRDDTAAAMVELAEAAGCEPNVSNLIFF